MTTTYTLKGCNDEETICARCGRTELNRVVWLAELDEDGNESKPEPYGTTCAARLLTPKQQRGTADHLVRIAKAVTYIRRWNTGAYSLDDIRNAVGVKFSVWATVEGNEISVNTPTGWMVVA
jgi:hypothetical protein